MAGKITIEGHSIEVGSESKVLFPRDGITKKDLLNYYQRVSKTMLPHLQGRPITMQRFPDGLEGEGFYQKEISQYFPPWIERVAVKKEGGKVNQVICEDTVTLLYLAEQACITLHISLSRVDRPYNPDLMIFDLDPSGKNFKAVRQSASLLRELLEELKLVSYIKTTGSRGVHVTVPLDRKADFNDTHVFAKDVAGILTKHHPKLLTDEQRKEKRYGRIFIDYLRNSYGQTAVAPYSVRAIEGAPVATPIDWEELNNSRLHPQCYNTSNIFRRLSHKADPWAGILNNANSLKKARELLDRLI